MKEILGEAKTVRSLLSGSRYSIDYYQREYKWETRQVRELLEDLADKFLDSHEVANERAAVQQYGHYFLGSIILSLRGHDTYIIDGQQRLTTLTLLLIYLQRRQSDRPDPVKLDDLILSQKYGKKSFNLDVEERRACMEALFNGESYDATDASESVQNIVARYSDIEEHFSGDIDEDALPYFADWLIENVHLVEISAHSDEDAYTIFETMNDRGLSLTPLDMLKGFVLANITDNALRLEANASWKARLQELQEVGKEEDSDAVKAWLRSQHAETIRERKKNAQPGDFDRMGTEFHRWLRDNNRQLGLVSSSDFAIFVQRDFHFYTRQYLSLRTAAHTLTPGLEPIYYNARFEFTLQYPLLLAPLLTDDSDDTIRRKLRVVGSFIDILIARRLWNSRSIAYSTMQYSMFVVMREIRRKSLDDLIDVLQARLADDEETFVKNERYGLNRMSRWPIHNILARMTDYIETESGLSSHFTEYLAEGKNRYEVEHIWADKYERHTDEFEHPTDFAEYRNRIGGLLLLPKSFNASYGALPYGDKLPHYYGQNLLAKSLDPRAYEHNPGFRRFIERSGLPFEPCPEFRKADLDKRQELYRRLAELIWDPARLEREASATTDEAVFESSEWEAAAPHID
jgi:hypothetical protein